MLIRRIVPIEGNPRVKIRLRPRFDYGSIAPTVTLRLQPHPLCRRKFAMRLTTDAPIDYLLEETAFKVTEPIHLILGPDETLTEGAAEIGRNLPQERTPTYWRTWTHRLAVPLEWQEAVIRAAITLKLCNYEPTGAIVAAMTTSIPEAPDSAAQLGLSLLLGPRRVLRRAGAQQPRRRPTLENYFRWIMNIVADVTPATSSRCIGIALERKLTERTVDHLPGYRGMGPVRVGNQALRAFPARHLRQPHPGGGAGVLRHAAVHDARRRRISPSSKLLGERAFQLYDKPDAGIWELRSRARVHTSSSLMCWAACDRLAKIALHLRSATGRAQFWRERADHDPRTRSWRAPGPRSARRSSRASTARASDASVLLMSEVGFIEPQRPALCRRRVEQHAEGIWERGPHLMRYEDADDFGKPETAFNVCAFWHVDALARDRPPRRGPGEYSKHCCVPATISA